MAVSEQKVSNREYEKITDAEERRIIQDLLPPMVAFFVITDTLAFAAVKPELSKMTFAINKQKKTLTETLTKSSKRKIQRIAEKLYIREFASRKGTETIKSLEDGIVRRIKRSIRKIPLSDGSGLPFPKKTGDIRYNRRRSLQKTLPRTSAERITNSIFDNVKRGKSSRQIERDVRKHLSRVNKNRAQLIARTEATAIRNAIAERAAKNEGYKYKIWNTQRDRRVRRAHRRLDGVSRLIKNKFRAVYKGFTRALSRPSEPRCRCYLTFRRRKK